MWKNWKGKGKAIGSTSGVTTPSNYRAGPTNTRPPGPLVIFQQHKVKLSAHLETLPTNWIPSGENSVRPPVERIQLIRELIRICFNRAREFEVLSDGAYLTCNFKMEDMCVVDGEITLDVMHSAPFRIGQPLEFAIQQILGTMPDVVYCHQRENSEILQLTNYTKKCESASSLAGLYFQPILCTPKETAHFLLDLALASNMDGEMKNILRTTYPNVNGSFEKMEGYKILKSDLIGPDKTFGDTYNEALNCAKLVAHHFNEYIGTNLPLEEVMKKYLKQFPTLPLKVYQLLQSADFQFELFMEDELTKG